MNRVVIKCLFLKGNMFTQIKDESVAVYEESASPFTNVRFWTAEFKHGSSSLGDDGRSGRPKIANTDNNINKIHQKMLDNLRIKMREITDAMSMTKEHT
ncbi:HTH_48 domain-containing protein [Nephila pilipes]|uniref:HTH_48 domain-containing protein n=1 Tax=Nephila pilipes TaxID=299642 RepID=A0A8X6NNR2_NEPPI|nr:HTH_48 domain-containing protein [Nephila pilipes]